MFASTQSKSKFDIPNVTIILWVVGLFFAFGVVSNLFDHKSPLYNLVQGLFVSLFVGGILYIARRISIRKVLLTE